MKKLLQLFLLITTIFCINSNVSAQNTNFNYEATIGIGKNNFGHNGYAHLNFDYKLTEKFLIGIGAGCDKYKLPLEEFTPFTIDSYSYAKDVYGYLSPQCGVRIKLTQAGLALNMRFVYKNIMGADIRTCGFITGLSF